MGRPWDHPGDHEDHESREIFYLRHLTAAVAGVGEMLVSNEEKQGEIMASLDGLTTAVGSLATAVSDMATRLDAKESAEAAEITTLQGQVSDLQGQVATLQADAVDPMALQSLVDQVTAIATTVAGIAAAAPAPVV